MSRELLKDSRRFHSIKERTDLKNKTRKSKEWRQLRKDLKERQKYDPITGSKLIRTANCHHLSLDADFYDDLNTNRFILLNPKTHEFIHFLYDNYKKHDDWEFLDMAKLIISKMDRLTKYDKEKRELC